MRSLVFLEVCRLFLGAKFSFRKFIKFKVKFQNVNLAMCSLGKEAILISALRIAKPLGGIYPIN
ncbi:hypothetical protein SAMN06265379_1263 [Saccharicrinis carchari]|uniref:Uncharacterized protein n=1 Tax=Saccharicrinis carchari TaxID=1168039 RepID=A0A521FF53_SACCC|nr:hypothetical protein SAMN06265379_1263 [Saccharicrinis carchari]